MQKGFGLKLIILYKTTMGISELILTVVLLNFLDKDLESMITGYIQASNLDLDGFFVQAVMKNAGMVSGGMVRNALIILFLFGVFNLVESYGLHKRMKWGEWLTVIATGSLIPFEIIAVVQHFSAVKLLVLVINCLIVYYLAKHKELFKKRSPRTAHQR